MRKEDVSVSETVSESDNEKGRFLPFSETVSEIGNEKEKNDARKEASEKANEYRKILSEKRQSEAGKKAVTVREIKRGNIDVETVSSSINEEQERSRKEASDKFKVSVWKVRTVQEIEKTAPEVYEAKRQKHKGQK